MGTLVYPKHENIVPYSRIVRNSLKEIMLFQQSGQIVE